MSQLFGLLGTIDTTPEIHTTSAARMEPGGHARMTTAIDMILRCRQHQLNGGDAPVEFYLEMAVRGEETVQGPSTYLPQEPVVLNYIPEGQSALEIAEREAPTPVSAPNTEGIPTMPSNAEGWA